MRDLLPLSIRGEFYAKRMAYGKFASLMAVLAVAAIFHFASDFYIPFLIAFVAGIVSCYFIKGIDDVEVQRGRRDLRRPLRDKNFLKLTAAISLEVCLRHGDAVLLCLHYNSAWVSSMGGNGSGSGQPAWRNVLP